MSGTVLSRTDRHTAHSSGAARSANALRRTAAASSATAPAVPAVPRPAGGDRPAESDADADPAAAAALATAGGTRTEAPGTGASAQPVVPSAALTVTLAIPLTGEALTPEAYRLLEALRDLVERGQGSVTTIGAGHSGAGTPTGGTPTGGTPTGGVATGVPRPAGSPTFSDRAPGAPVFGGVGSGPTFIDPVFGDPSTARPAANGTAANGVAVDGPAPAGFAPAGPAPAGFAPVAARGTGFSPAGRMPAAPVEPELADPDVRTHPTGRPGPSRSGVFRADAAAADWPPSGAPRPVDPAEVRLLTASRQVLLGGVPLAMTRLEFDLLLFLAGNPRRVFTRAQLLGAVWGYEHTGERTVDVHVRRLRVKMGVQVPLITTVYGVGYRLDDDARIVVVSHS